MYKREVTYLHDGDTFVGRYHVTDLGQVHSVSVQFEGSSISARVSGLREEMVARTLLGELVREKFAETPVRQRAGESGTSVARLERRGPAAPSQGVAA